MIWDSFKSEYDMIEKSRSNFISKRAYVEYMISDYIGTISEIKEEMDRLGKEWAETLNESRVKRGESLETVISAYKKELFSDYSNYPLELLEKAYSLSWEDHHSSGFEEVENFFECYVDTIIWAYKLGLSSR